MRILSLTWGFGLGGIGRCLLSYNRLNEYPDFKVHTACITLRDVNSDLKPLKAIDATIITIKNRRDFSWMAKTIKLINEFKPDVLFVHGFNGPVIARILQWKLKRKLPFVCSNHGLYYPPNALRKIIAPILNWLMLSIYKRYAKGILAVSNYSKGTLINMGIPAEKITLIHNGLPNYVIDKKVYANNDQFIIGTAVRLDPFKGIETLIEAFAVLLKIHKNSHLEIVGSGPYKSSLQNKVSELGIQNNVLFLGFRPDVDDCLRNFDLFILPSLFENHSIAILEAMRAGKAIIATDVGGNTESVRDGQEALIVPAADSKALENALKRMIEDSALRERLGKAARRRFEMEFTEDKMLEKLAGWFRSMEFSQQ